MKHEISQSIKKEWLTTKKVRGFALIEAILASSLFVMFLTAFAGVFFYGEQAQMLAGDRSRAIMYAEEGQEAVRSMRNNSYSSVVDGTHGLVYSDNAWSFSGASDTSGNYTRTTTVTTVDANRKDVTTTVTWQQTPSRVGSVTLTGRLTNWKTVLNLGEGLMVNKIVINHGLSRTVNDFAPYRVGTTTIQLATSTKFPAGTYTVSETIDPNFIQTFSGDCNGSGQVTLTSSSSLLCTITNEERLSYITATATVINHGGTKVPADFAPFSADGTILTLGAPTVIDSGSHQITSATTSNYTRTFSGDCFTDGTVTLTSGDNKTCIITFEEQQLPGDGGSLSLSGLIIYGDGTNVPKYRAYNVDEDTFGAETGTFTATVGPTWLIRTSPNAHYAIAGYYDNTSTLTIMCFNGTSWTQEFSAASGGVGNRHRFDIAFEKTSGNVVVLYSKGGSSGDSTRWGKLGYRTKSGNTGCGASNWSGESIFDPARTSNDIMYVKLVQDRRLGSNILGATWVDTSDDISMALWDGAAFVNEPTNLSDNNVQRVSSSHDIENMDLDFESLSGNFMVVWGNGSGNNGTNGVRYRRCIGGTVNCTWAAVSTPPTFADDATTLDLAANPNTNEMVFASIGRGGGDLQLGYWNGNSWVNTANADITSTVPYVASKLVATGWLTAGSSTRSIVVYSDLNSQNINWYTGNQGVFTRQPDFIPSPLLGTSRGYMDIQQDPVSQDQLMYVTSNSSSHLYAKRLLMTASSTFTWSNSDGAALETNLPQVISSPFSFGFWQQ